MKIRVLPERENPLLAVLLGIFGLLEMIGGIVLCVKLWPGAAETGYRWLFSAYVPALTWLATGLVSGVVFFAFAAVVTYLVQIRNLTEVLGFSLFRLESALGGDRKHEEEKG